MFQYRREDNCALLIGTSESSDGRLIEVPSVQEGLRELKEYWSPKFDFTRAKPLENRSDRARLLAKITKHCNSTKGGLLVLYSGHGLYRNSRLYLSLKRTNCDNCADTAVEFADIAERVAASPAKRKVVILDCCHAERGLLNVASLKARINTEGTYVIAAAQSHEAAKVMRLNEPTLFVSELLRVLRYGHADSPKRQDGQLTVDEVYQAVKARLDHRRKAISDTPHVVRAVLDKGDEIVIGQVLGAPYRELAAAAIGVSPRKLPGMVGRNIEVIGRFHMVQLVVELEDLLIGACEELGRWLDETRVGMGEWSPRDMVAENLREIRRTLSVLTRRCKQCEAWPPYSELAGATVDHLERFIVRLMRIVDGYDPDCTPASEFARDREEPQHLADVRAAFLGEATTVRDALQPLERAAHGLREKYEETLA